MAIDKSRSYNLNVLLPGGIHIIGLWPQVANIETVAQATAPAIPTLHFY